MNKKGQAAMEFLMTYGWAILVVIAAIGALAYFGILSPEKVLPERCTGTPGLDCLEKASIDATADTIEIALKNNLGKKINVTSVSVTSSECSSVSSTSITVEGGSATTPPVEVDNNKRFNIKVTCNDFSEGRLSADFSVQYTSLDTGLQQKAAISVKGKAVA